MHVHVRTQHTHIRIDMMTILPLIIRTPFIICLIYIMLAIMDHIISLGRMLKQSPNIEGNLGKLRKGSNAQTHIH